MIGFSVLIDRRVNAANPAFDVLQYSPKEISEEQGEIWAQGLLLLNELANDTLTIDSMKHVAEKPQTEKRPTEES